MIENTDNSPDNSMPDSVYRYIFQKSFWQQVVVISLTLILLPLVPVPLELHRRIQIRHAAPSAS